MEKGSPRDLWPPRNCEELKILPHMFTAAAEETREQRGVSWGPKENQQVRLVNHQPYGEEIDVPTSWSSKLHFKILVDLCPEGKQQRIKSSIRFSGNRL